MLAEQKSYIRKHLLKAYVSTKKNMQLITDDFPWVIRFYNTHTETKPTEAECYECLKYLDDHFVDVMTMIYTRKSYQEAGADVPELELEFSRVVRCLKLASKVDEIEAQSQKDSPEFE